MLSPLLVVPPIDVLDNRCIFKLQNLEQCLATFEVYTIYDQWSRSHIMQHSPFFINLVDNDFLDFTSPTPQGFGYAVFGEVIDGMAVVDAIAKVKTGFAGPHQNVPETPVIIRKVTVA